MARKQAHDTRRRGVGPGESWSAERLYEATARRPESLREFLTREVTTDRGEPFSLDGRQVWSPVVDLLDDVLRRAEPDRSFDVIAGAQIGKSTLMTGLAGALPANGYNAIYFLPSDRLADRFDDTRWKPVAARSPWLKANAHDGAGGGVDRKGLHAIAGRWLYILGLETIANAISIQSDALIYDEADLIPADNLTWSADRLDASSLRLQVSISVGMLEGAGIDERYRLGCQNMWVVRCPACRYEQILEDEFPACVQRVDGQWARVCVRCGKPYDVEASGRWVAQAPGRMADGFYSWRMPQLIVPAVSLDGIMRKWDRARTRRSRLAKFKCSVLAKPDGGDLQPITHAVLQRCRPEPFRMSLSRGVHPRFAGIDTGDSAHYAVHELLPDGRRRWVYFEELDADALEERVEQLDDALGVQARVCDSKPLRTEARRLAYRRPFTTWLLDFAGEDEEPEWEVASHFGRQHQRAVVGRDAALDELVSLLTSEPPLALLPGGDGHADAVLDTLDAHLRALTKERKEDARGNTIETYRRGVPNHFGFAMLGSMLAEQLFLKSRPADWKTSRRFEMADALRRTPGGLRRAMDVLEGY